MTDNLTRALLVAALISSGACTDGKDAATDSGGDSVGADSSAAEVLYTINGLAITFGPDQNPAAEGLCVEAVDPSGVLEGGEAEVVSQTTVGAGGAYTLSDVPRRGQPTVVVVRDCEGAASTVYPTGSPVLPFDFQSITEGQALDDVRSVSLSNTTLAAFETGLALAGYAGDLPAEGFALGAVWTPDQQPISGAQLTCGGCGVYYADADPSDGPFTTGGVKNTSTSGSALWIIPAAPPVEYGVTAEGYTFPKVTFAAPPGGALFGILTGQPS